MSKNLLGFVLRARGGLGGAVIMAAVEVLIMHSMAVRVVGEWGSNSPP